jgi:hypothetical protein
MGFVDEKMAEVIKWRNQPWWGESNRCIIATMLPIIEIIPAANFLIFTQIANYYS